MKRSAIAIASMATAILGLGLASPAEARHHRRHHHHHSASGHGDCLRFNKATGTVAGAVGGGVLGNVLVGGTGATLIGAAAGGVAGHELSRNGRKHC